MERNTIVNTSVPLGIPQNGINPMQMSAAETDAASLPTTIMEWRRIQDDMEQLKIQLRERTRRIRVLENSIMETMKRCNIGALDLKASGGRIVYKRSKRSSGLAATTLNKLLAECLQNEEKAQEVIKYISEHRETKVSERLAYEHLDFDDI